jgi:hypothetical protein
VGALVGRLTNERQQNSIKNCYNAGNYSATSNQEYHALLGNLENGANCTYTNCWSLNYGANKTWTTVIVNNSGYLSESDLKSSASRLGGNYKTATGTMNRWISVTNLAIMHMFNLNYI